MNNDKDIWTVSRLNRAAQQLLEGHFPRLWLEGELSNFKAYGSGHWYFSLKDDQAQIQGVMFKGSNQKVSFRPADGQQVRVQVQVSLFAPQGKFQLQVLQMQQAGTGALLLQLEQLKQKLNAEGLFAADHKQALPTLPRQVGVITSPSGAAIHDILTVFQRRCPQLPLVIYPASVQGQAAPAELLHALSLAVARHECDLLIIGRGGGSLEDLFCFNDEALTRAVAACPIPIISAVGHEVDFSLTDLAADLRAPTPSAAAELACPDMRQWQQQCQTWQQRLQQSLARRLAEQQQRLAQLQQRLTSPQRLLLQHSQRIDELHTRMDNAWRQRLRQQQSDLHHLQQRLGARQPALLLQQQQSRHSDAKLRLERLMADAIKRSHQQLAPLMHRLDMAAPENLLKRGYSLTFLADGQQLVRANTPLPVGSKMITRLAGNREVHSEVTAAPTS